MVPLHLLALRLSDQQEKRAGTTAVCCVRAGRDLLARPVSHHGTRTAEHLKVVLHAELGEPGQQDLRRILPARAELGVDGVRAGAVQHVVDIEHHL